MNYRDIEKLLLISDASDFEINEVDKNNFEILKSGKPTYNVSITAEGTYSCTCPGFKYRRTCKHINEVKSLKEPKKSKPQSIRHPRSEFERFIPELTEICRPFDRWEAVGSWRRQKPTFKDVDVIALGASAWKQVHKALQESGAWEEMIYGPTLMRGLYHGYYLDFNLCPSQDMWVWWLLYRTGSADFNVEMRKRAIRLGYALSENGLQDRYTFEKVRGLRTEKDIFDFLGLEYLEPKYREPQFMRNIKGFDFNKHKSEGLKLMEVGDFDWKDYLLESIDKLKNIATYSKQAKYPARLAIVVAREISRRTGTPAEHILSQVDPDEIQPEGFKRGQQSWDKNGNVFRTN